MDSIIFDLDGTLWDSTDTVVVAWNSVLENYKEDISPITAEDLQGVMGLQIEEVGRRLLPNVEAERQHKILIECCDAENESLVKRGGKLYPNLEPVLIALSRKYKLFIVSNCQEGYIESFFAYHQVGGYFTDYENPGRTGLSKGENIKLVMERNQLKSPVYVGDTEGDHKAALFAGIPFIYARYGFGEASGYDDAIDRLDGLLELF
ncbi:HAD family hydrolase [Paenibacillus sp. NFR01]|uniref:HAD family hydrolase n=1 Tax=Paenibacillus sp. NFR01 TaxID=1566279 RepID=UPI0008D257AC|nr:HAD family hydrolase [Paenibacillus sp. NFR01]SET11225.1 phosphoglycolate phosphatase [Paenibacillus sp. NFR01]